MIKYYLKNSDKKQEVKVGDRITISVPTHTPYGQAKCDIEVLVTQDSLKQLIKDNLVIAKDEFDVNPDTYKPFVRRIARKCGITFPDALTLLDSIKAVSIHAHNALLLEAIAESFNTTRSKGDIVYVINGNGVVNSCMDLGMCVPYFISKVDAMKAAELMKPFYDEARKGKQKD